MIIDFELIEKSTKEMTIILIHSVCQMVNPSTLNLRLIICECIDLRSSCCVRQLCLLAPHCACIMRKFA